MKDLEFQVVDDDEKPDPNQVKQELGQLFPAPRVERDTFNDLTTNLPYLSADDLQAFVQERAMQQAMAVNNAASISRFDYLSTDDDDDDMFSVTLDANAYLQATDRLQPDGSLKSPNSNSAPKSGIIDVINPLLTAPPSPSSSGLERAISEQELNRLHQAWQETQQALLSETPPPEDTGKELHDKVFSEEQGFLNQSPVFVDSLLDERQSEPAWVERHGEVYRTRQDDAMELLEKQILELEQNLEWFAAQKGVPRCFRCEGALNMLEIARNEGVRRKICMVCHAEDLAKHRPGSQRRS